MLKDEPVRQGELRGGGRSKRRHEHGLNIISAISRRHLGHVQTMSDPGNVTRFQLFTSEIPSAGRRDSHGERDDSCGREIGDAQPVLAADGSETDGKKRGVAPRTLRIMLFGMRSFSLDWLGLSGLTILSAACSHNGASPNSASAPPPGTVSLELQQGPAPALPNPMLVTDSVHGGASRAATRRFDRRKRGSTISSR